MRDRFEQHLAASLPREWEALDEDGRRELLEAFGTVMKNKMSSKPQRVAGPGVRRYENVLAQARLDAGADRPIPDDLDEALRELSAIRNVLVHRGGRVDDRALRDAPSLASRYQEGEHVQIVGADYRKYSAAVRAYGQDVCARLAGPRVVPSTLADWRNARYVTA